MDIFKKILIALGLLAGAYGAGYYFAPDKVKTVEKIVEIEKEVITKEREVIEKYDPITGKLIERIVRDKDKKSKKSEEKNEKTVEKEKTKKHYAVKVGVVQAITKAEKPTYRVGGEVRLPVFNSWAGLEADIDTSKPKLGAYLRMEF